MISSLARSSAGSTDVRRANRDAARVRAVHAKQIKRITSFKTTTVAATATLLAITSAAAQTGAGRRDHAPHQVRDDEANAGAGAAFRIPPCHRTRV